MFETRSIAKTLIAGCTVVCLSFGVQANVMVGGSMESQALGSYASAGFTFTSTGNWSVDPLSIVNAENGATPLDGTQMLRFGAGGGGQSDVYNVVDVSALAVAIDTGTATADLSAFFNGLGVENTSLSLRSYSGAEPTGANPVSGGLFTNVDFQANPLTDSNTSTWEEFSINNYVIAAGTRYIAVGLHSARASASYADQVTLTISSDAIPEPGSLAVFGLGLAGLGYIRRHKLH
ncbi:MAG: PEP-CTERM sorting domain-containing protein [Alphaproteobacteria bacterium]|nr:PEP-CTERM sorting domain-containing protein [Alphaproteobacteria bacterium]